MSKRAKKQKKINKARKKIGVNDPCPCGSGIKYKRCCLNKIPSKNVTPIQLKPIPFSEAPPELIKLLEDQKVLEKQRVAQQGHGRPIVSTEFKGRRFVVIGNKIFDSGNCKTFHEVLPVYRGGPTNSDKVLSYDL